MKTLKSILSIALREAAERRSFLALSLVLGLIPFLVMQVKTFGLSLGKNDIGTVSIMVMLAFTIGFGLINGASLIGRDFAERRMSFYFARPLSAFSIWGGKVLGGLVMTMLSGIIMLLPVMLFFGTAQDRANILSVGALADFFLANIFFLSVGLIIGIIFRSKSYWLALDLAMVPVSIALFVYAAKRLFTPYGYYGHDSVMVPYFFIGGLSTLMLAGSAAAVMIGRTDIKRAHRALSITFWVISLFGLTSFEGYSRWYVSADVKDITSLDTMISGAPQGSWLTFSGKAWGRSENYHPTFLFNTSTGKSVKLNGNYGTDVVFSQDGKRAVWTNAVTSLSAPTYYQLVTMNLDDANATPQTTTITFTNDEYVRMLLNNDGSKLAAIGNKMVTIYDMNSQKDISSAYIQTVSDNRWQERVSFVDADHLRIYRPTRQPDGQVQVSINELDIPAKKITQLGQFICNAGLLVSPDGQTVMALRASDDKAAAALYNGSNGQLIAELLAPTAGIECNGRFLADGRVIIVKRTKEDKNTLSLFSKTGEKEKDIELGTARRFSIGGQQDTNQLVLALHPNDSSKIKDAQLILVDLAAGTATAKMTGFYPTSIFYYFYNNGTMTMPAGNEMSHIYLSADGGLSKIDFATGATQKLEALKLAK